MENSDAIDPSSNQDQNSNQLVKGCQHCLQQCELLLGLVSQESYSARSEPTSSIGAHVRHILDRFQCFFAGLQSGTINYDARKRDQSIEANLEAASFALSSVSRRIDTLDLSEVLGRTVAVRESVYHESPLAEIPSTFDRELTGLISHSTHHLAIIALIAKSLGYALDADFGKAPSTIVYERH
jgi:uncharacterized damage-inducible protein DinB